MEKNPPNNIASPFFRNNKFKLEEDVLRNTSFKISNIYGINENIQSPSNFFFILLYLYFSGLRLRQPQIAVCVE